MKKYTYLYRVSIETMRKWDHRYYEFDEPKSKEYIIGKAYLDFGFNAKGKPLLIKIVEISESLRENNQMKDYKSYTERKDYIKDDIE